MKKKKIDQEMLDALQQLEDAEKRFNDASPDFIEVAVLELKAAEIRVNELIKRRKK